MPVCRDADLDIWPQCLNDPIEIAVSFHRSANGLVSSFLGAFGSLLALVGVIPSSAKYARLIVNA